MATNPTPEDVPIQLLELYVEDWCHHSEQPPAGWRCHQSDTSEGEAWLWRAITARGRQTRARADFAADHGISFWDMVHRYPVAWSAPRWRNPPSVARRTAPRAEVVTLLAPAIGASPAAG